MEPFAGWELNAAGLHLASVLFAHSLRFVCEHESVVLSGWEDRMKYVESIRY